MISWHPHDVSQLSVAPVPRDHWPPEGTAHMWHIDIQAAEHLYAHFFKYTAVQALNHPSL